MLNIGSIGRSIPQPSPSGEGAKLNIGSIGRSIPQPSPSGEGLGGVLSRDDHRVAPTPPKFSSQSAGVMSSEGATETSFLKIIPSCVTGQIKNLFGSHEAAFLLIDNNHRATRRNIIPELA